MARELLDGDGDIPLALSRYLRRNDHPPPRAYADVAELEFRDANGHPIAEADLISLEQDALIVAEAKSTSTLDPASAKAWRTAAHKRVLLADLLDADQTLLATSQPAREQSSITAQHGRNLAQRGDMIPVKRPRFDAASF